MPALSIGVAVLVLLSANSELFLEHPLPIRNSSPLQYDDGTANWISWSGLYRGVWFNLQDFYGGGGDFWLENLEFWFYHHSSYPWDTSAFYGELYDGGSSGPENQLNQTSVTALHYAPCYAEYPWPGNEQIFQNSWGLVNTEMSSGGWPSLLGDNTPNSVSHSFFSDDFIDWEPWIISGPAANDFFIRANGSLSHMTESTWGSIKALF